jgi:endonuclease YncB( thermonuclease family)
MQRNSPSRCDAAGLALLCLLAFAWAIPRPAGAADLSGFVFMQDDGTLHLKGRTIHLFGIYIPPTAEDCYTFIRPPPCAPRAVLALEFHFGNDFLRCDITDRRPDGTLTARCRSDDEDLSAWMLRQGWAVALPDAPFEYHALEKIARAQGRGIWGLPGRIVR